MTKRDFELVADILAALDGTEVDKVAAFFADCFEQEFPRFNREIFLRRCAVGSALFTSP